MTLEWSRIETLNVNRSELIATDNCKWWLLQNLLSCRFIFRHAWFYCFRVDVNIQSDNRLRARFWPKGRIRVSFKGNSAHPSTQHVCEYIADGNWNQIPMTSTSWRGTPISELFFYRCIRRTRCIISQYFR